MDNAQRSIAMQSNILYETVKEGLWGISSQGIRSETCDSVNFSLYIKSHWSRTKEQLQIRRTKTPLWGASERINEHWYTFAHSVLPWPQLHHGKQHEPINAAQRPSQRNSSNPLRMVELKTTPSHSVCVYCQWLYISCAGWEQLGMFSIYYPICFTTYRSLSLKSWQKVTKHPRAWVPHSSHASPWG